METNSIGVFEQTSDNFKKCRRCQEMKATDQFYVCGGRVQTLCKDCMSDNQRLLTFYGKHALEDITTWPADILELVKNAYEYQQVGGKVDYGKGAIAEMLERWMIYSGLTPERDDAVPQDLLEYTYYKQKQLQTAFGMISDASDDIVQGANNLLDVLRDFENRLHRIENSLGLHTATSYRGWSIQDLQERNNLVTAIRDDKHLQEIFGEYEHKDFMNYLEVMIENTDRLGYVPPEPLRNLIAQLESFQLGLTDELRKLYTKFFLPALRFTMTLPEYEDYAKSVVDFLGTNFYEVNWDILPTNRE